MMGYDNRKFIPYIPSKEYDKVASEFLEQYYPEALMKPIPVPIEQIAKTGLGLDIQYITLSEEQDIFGMTVFTDGIVEVYNPTEMLYDSISFKSKTMLIDPEAVKKTNIGCLNNTIAHECVHWYKHRYYYKMQKYEYSRYANYCKCYVAQIPELLEDESIMEAQATGIAPRILMPRATFVELAETLGVSEHREDIDLICYLADFFKVSKQSARIRIKECCL